MSLERFENVFKAYEDFGALLQKIKGGAIEPFERRKIVPLLRREVWRGNMSRDYAIRIAKGYGLSTGRLERKSDLFLDKPGMLDFDIFQYEACFQDWIIDEALLHEWLVEHIEGGTRIEVGYPDMRLAHRELRRSVTVELKTDNGSLFEEQIEWLRTLADCGEQVAVWRPSLRHEIQKYLWGLLYKPPSAGIA